MNIKIKTMTANIPVASMANEGNKLTANIRNISMMIAGKYVLTKNELWDLSNFFRKLIMLFHHVGNYIHYLNI